MCYPPASYTFTNISENGSIMRRATRAVDEPTQTFHDEADHGADRRRCRSLLSIRSSERAERFCFDYILKTIIFLLLVVAIHSDTIKLKPASYIDCAKVMDHWQMACSAVQDDMLAMK